MNLSLAAFVASLAAAFAAWMLSGSPVPMALTLLLVPLALLCGFLTKLRMVPPLARTLLAALLACAAAWFEYRLYQTGQALALRAEMPTFFHLGMALLWWAAIEPLIQKNYTEGIVPRLREGAGLCGGLLVLAASAGTVLYDFGPWQTHPVAALPFAIWATRLLLPAMKGWTAILFGAMPASLALAGLLLAASFATASLRAALFPNDEASLIDAPDRPSAGPGGGSRTDGASRQLPREADVRFQGKIMLQVQAHSPELFRRWTRAPLYVRTSSLALFESEEVVAPIRSGRWRYDEDDGLVDHRVVLDGDNTPPDLENLHTLYITRDSVGHLPLLCGSSALLAAAVYEFADDWYQLAPAEGINRLRYTAATGPGPPHAAAALPSIRDLRSVEAPGVYLLLPPSPLAAEVSRLGASLDPTDPLGAIRRHLEAKTSYSLQFRTPEGSSPLRHFLFGEGTGHCEHYAAATVLLLRSVGIASRIAYGYAGGVADASQRLLAFRDSDFHAWAEILAPGNEWIVFDTTPRVAGAAPRMTGASSLPPMDVASYHDFSEFDPSTVSGGGRWDRWIGDAVDLLSRHFFAASAAGLSLLAGVWWFLPSGRRRRLGGDADTSHGRAGSASRLPGFLQEIERGAAARGIVRRPGETWRELLGRLSCAGLVPTDCELAVAYHYHTTYEKGTRDRELESRLAGQLREWAEGAAD